MNSEPALSPWTASRNLWARSCADTGLMHVSPFLGSRVALLSLKGLGGLNLTGTSGPCSRNKFGASADRRGGRKLMHILIILPIRQVELDSGVRPSDPRCV